MSSIAHWSSIFHHSDLSNHAPTPFCTTNPQVYSQAATRYQALTRRLPYFFLPRPHLFHQLRLLCNLPISHLLLIQSRSFPNYHTISKLFPPRGWCGRAYLVYRTSNTPSTCPQSCRSLLVYPSGSPNSAFVTRDCTSGKALPRWATRSRSELDRLYHKLRHWEGSVFGSSDGALRGRDVRSQHLAVHCPVCGFGRHLGAVGWVTPVLVKARARDRRISAHLGSSWLGGGVVNEACTLAQKSCSEEERECGSSGLWQCSRIVA